MSSPLLDKSKAFALQIIRVCNTVKSSRRESVLTNQLLRSGTSIGANIREAFYAHGKAVQVAAERQLLTPVSLQPGAKASGCFFLKKRGRPLLHFVECSDIILTIWAFFRTKAPKGPAGAERAPKIQMKEF